MKDYNTKSHKTDGFRTKPVRVETRDNREIEAVHHVVNDRAQLLHLYLDEREGGFDLSIPLSNVRHFARSAAGVRAIGVNDDSDTIGSDRVSESGELAADGGDI